MPRKHRKPTGKLEGIALAGDTARLRLSHLPEEKDAIERRVVAGWLASRDGAWRRAYRLKADPRQGAENGFDFILPTEVGDHYLELMEVAPLDEHQGSYENIPSLRYAGPVADQIWERVTKKSVKYGGRKNAKLHLLLYSAASSTHLDDSVLWLLAHSFAMREHVFASVVYFALLDEEQGVSFPPLHPVPRGTFDRFDEAAARSSWFLTLRPSLGTQTSDGRGWTIPMHASDSSDRRSE